MTPLTSLRRGGFTIYGVVVAVVLFGVALHPIVSTLANNTRIATDRRDRMDAERVLQNEIAILAAADPQEVPASRSYRADRSGREDSAGRFEVSSRHSIRCSVGEAPTDNVLDPPPSGCPGRGVVHDYTITVSFSRAARPGETAQITRIMAVNAGRSLAATPSPSDLP